MADADMVWLASVYWELWRLSGGSVGPRQADELEIWEVAVLLRGTSAWGIVPPEVEAKQQEADPHAHLRARLRHAQGRGPEFSWDEPTPDEQAEMMALVTSLNE